MAESNNFYMILGHDGEVGDIGSSSIREKLSNGILVLLFDTANYCMLYPREYNSNGEYYRFSPLNSTIEDLYVMSTGDITDSPVSPK